MSKHTDPKTAPAAPIYYTGRVNDLGDELCVVDAYSDLGERGWMVCEEVRAPGRKVTRSPYFWYPSDKRAEAINASLAATFYGYPKLDNAPIDLATQRV